MKLRKFVSLFLFINFIILVFSGIILFIVPHGRVANWIGWTFLWLNKDQWEAIHTIFGFLFVLFVITHIYLNRKVMINYIKQKTSSFVSKEFLLIVILSVVIFMWTVYNLPPFNWIVQLWENIKDSVVVQVRPPFPHAENASLQKICITLKLDCNKLVEKLKNNNIKISSMKDSLKDIAEMNNLTPEEVFKMIKILSNRKNISNEMWKDS